MMKKLILGLLIILSVTAVAQAAVVMPVKAAVDPIHASLFVPFNFNKTLIPYVRNGGNIPWISQEAISLPAPSYGLASSGSKLYVSTNQAANSKLLVYTLDASGLPVGAPASNSFTCGGASLSPTEVLVDLVYKRIYVADQGGGRIHVHDLTGKHTGDITDQVWGKTFLYGLTVSDNYLFVSRRSNPGEIYVYNRSNFAYVTKITNADMVSPTYIKAVKFYNGDEKLFVANNNLNSQTMVLAFNIKNINNITLSGRLQALPDSFAGWKGLDVTPDGKYLVTTYHFRRIWPSLHVEEGDYAFSFAAINVNSDILLDPSALRQTTSFARSNLSALTISPDGQEIAYSNSDTGQVELRHDEILPNDPNGHRIAPSITSVTPDVVAYGANDTLTITGANFVNSPLGPFELYVDDGRQKGWRKLQNVQVISPTLATASALAEYAITPGVHQIKARNNYPRNEFADSTDLLPPQTVDLRVNFNEFANFTQLFADQRYENYRVVLSWDPLAQVQDTTQLAYTIRLESPDDNRGAITQVPNVISDEYQIGNLIPNTKYTASVKAASVPANQDEPVLTKDSPAITVYTPTNLSPRYSVKAVKNANDHPQVSWQSQDLDDAIALNVDRPGNPKDTQYELGRKTGNEPDYTVIAMLDASAISKTTVATKNGQNYEVYTYTYDDDNPNFKYLTGYTYAVRTINKAYADEAFRAQRPDLILRTSAWDRDPAEIAVDYTLPAPTISGLSPNTGALGATVPVTITGTGIQNGATLRLAFNGKRIEAPITVANGVATATLVIPLDAVTVVWGAVIINPDGQTSATLNNAFTITDQPVVVTISNLSIVRDGDTPDSSVTVSWATDPPASAVDVHALDGTFTTDANSWKTKVATNTTNTQFTDANQVGVNGNARYYKVVPADYQLANSDLTSEVVGKFDIVVNEGFNLISLPLITNTTGVNDVIGNQLTAGLVFNADGIYDAAGNKSFLSNDNKWHDANTQAVSNLEVKPDAGYYVEVGAGHGSKKITVVGKIPTTNRSVLLSPGFNLIGTTFPITVPLNNSNLAESGAFAGLVFSADNTYNAAGEKAFLSNGDNKWHDAVNTQNPPTVQLEPGKGYYFERKGAGAFTWNYTKPY